MNNITATIDILFQVFSMVFAFWWLVLLSPITAKSRRRKQPPILRNMLVMWVMLAVVRVFLLLSSTPVQGYFVPEPMNTLVFILCGVGLFALFVLLRRREFQAFVHKVGQVNSVTDLVNLSPTEFEDMVVELYRIAGHQAKRTGEVGDGGVDVVVQAKNGEKWIVQCKRWKGSVGAPVVRDFYGAMQHEKADKGTIIAAGRFTQPAVEWANGKPITLYDGEKFLRAWKQAQRQKLKDANPVLSVSSH
jgi:HJR/Mrr/RecB family endonuclease